MPIRIKPKKVASVVAPAEPIVERSPGERADPRAGNENIIIIGPPGSGKGTQAQMLEDRFGLTQISTGDLLRQAVRDGTPGGKKAKACMDAGKLVPDEIVMPLLEKKLTATGTDGWILDGFPRNTEQAVELQRILGKAGRSIDRVVVLEVDDEIIVSRITGRRSCGECNAIYHLEFAPPKKPDTCDDCNSSPLIHRADDTEKKMRVRLDKYHSQTVSVIPFYERAGLVTRASGSTPEEIFAIIDVALKDLVTQRQSK